MLRQCNTKQNITDKALLCRSVHAISTNQNKGHKCTPSSTLPLVNKTMEIEITFYMEKMFEPLIVF